MSNEELRSKYVKVSSQEEANKVYDYLESIGEIVDRNWNKYNDVYCYVVNNGTKWILTVEGNKMYSDYTEITLPEFLNEKYDTPKFEVGKWYEVELSNRFKHIFEFNGYLTTDEVDLRQGYYDKTSKRWDTATCFNLKKVTNYKNLDLSEIQQYLPDGHPDKIDYQNVLDIEVGDTVRCISENKSKFATKAGHGWQANLEFVVTEIHKYGEHNVYFYNGQGVFSDAVRLVKRKKGLTNEKETLYYKVALVDEAAGISCCKKGDIFSCENTEFTYCTSLKDNFPGWVCNIDFSDIFNTLQEAEEFAKTLIEPIKKEIDEKKSMTSEELLEEARKKYPIGTKCICLTDNTIETITSDLKWNEEKNRIVQINVPGTRVYYKGKWAEIVETPIKVKKGLSDVLERDFDGQVQGIEVDNKVQWNEQIPVAKQSDAIYIDSNYIRKKYRLDLQYINKESNTDDDGYYKVDTSMY